MKEEKKFKGDKFVKTVAVSLLCLWLAPVVNAQITQHEREALIALYEATDGDNWSNNDNWKVDGEFNDSGTEDTWHGVTVENDVITELTLPGNNLTGEIPSELGDLTSLTELTLTTNNLTGTIPAELENLTGLEQLHLPDNNLTGAIPTELGNLSNLTQLLLSKNNLSGDIPAELGNLSNLTHLRLTGNAFTGEIPPELGSLSNLIWFRVTSEDLSGNIPPELGNLSSLEMLWIGGGDEVTGEIPPELGNLSNLTELQIYGEGFEGEIPPELGNLSNLSYLRLSQANLAGTIPPELGNLINLSSLYLGANELTGEIPDELYNLPNLRILDLSNNNFAGAIPPELEKLPLLSLGLSENNFTGEIPFELFSITELNSLSLNKNNLTGEIPSEIENLSNLGILDLGYNNFSGEIPPELGNLNNLWVLSLESNSFTGQIPSELGNLTKIIVLKLHANEFFGEIPSSIVNLENLSLTNTDFNYNMLSATDPAVQDFLDLKDAGWDQTQTVAPQDIAATTGSGNAINVSWTPIPYKEDDGKYIVHFGTSPGVYTDCLMTEDKITSEIVLSDLDPDSSYYIAVQTYTPAHENNPNDLTSSFSSETDVQVESVTLELREGWNMIGTPFDLPGQPHSELFETVVGNLFDYELGYNEQEFLKFGTGYWLRSDGETEVELAGWLPAGDRTISLKEGWNMISGSTGSMDISDISDPDEILLPGTLYEYSADYVQDDTLEPGRGYWIRTSAEGEIILPEETSSKQLATGATTPSWDNGFLENFDKLVFYSEGEDKQMDRPIYFGGELPDEVHPHSLSLPPAGPGMVLDARMENDLYATTADTVRIHVKSAGQPLCAVFQPSQQFSPVKYVMAEYAGEHLIRTGELQEQTELRLADNSVDRMELYKQDENITKVKPDEFGLSQNYPNPFNPATVIGYQLPDAAHVRLEIFNITGRRIAVLIDGKQQAGFHQVIFEGASLASGTYLYRIRAGGFEKTRKFTLIK